MVQRMRNHHQSRSVFGQNHSGSHVEDALNAGAQVTAGRERKQRQDGALSGVREVQGGAGGREDEAAEVSKRALKVEEGPEATGRNGDQEEGTGREDESGIQ